MASACLVAQRLDTRLQGLCLAPALALMVRVRERQGKVRPKRLWCNGWICNGLYVIVDKCPARRTYQPKHEDGYPHAPLPVHKSYSAPSRPLSRPTLGRGVGGREKQNAARHAPHPSRLPSLTCLQCASGLGDGLGETSSLPVTTLSCLFTRALLSLCS